MSDTTQLIPAPTAQDALRDLVADYVTCEAASLGPWWQVSGAAVEGRHPDGYVGTVVSAALCQGNPWDETNAAFCAAARTGWPAALRLLAAARVECERLREALRPFAEYAARLEGWPEDTGMSVCSTRGAINPDLRDCRRARDALEGKP